MVICQELHASHNSPLAIRNSFICFFWSAWCDKMNVLNHFSVGGDCHL